MGDIKEQFSQQITHICETLKGVFPQKEVSFDNLMHIVIDSFGTKRMTDDLAELFRTNTDQVIAALTKLGIQSGSLMKSKQTDQIISGFLASPKGIKQTDSVRLSASMPMFNQAFNPNDSALNKIQSEWDNYLNVAKKDPFLGYYRQGVLDYLNHYESKISPVINNFIAKYFASEFPKYIVTVGIGANEQFWHYPQRWYACRNNNKSHWIVCDNPKDLAKLPKDSTLKNTVVIEFSRSGTTQEIVKFDEFLHPDAIRIIFANTGPLFELAKKHKNCLSLEFPDQIPGRFGKNLTPMLLVPMDLLKLPFKEYWKKINSCIEAWDLQDPNSPPMAIARYLRAAQLFHGSNHIYLGTNDEILLGSCDELVQFWNEGVNKDANDFLMSRYFGLPRDSHLNIEGILSNNKTKCGIFVISQDDSYNYKGELICKNPEFVNPAHSGLDINKVDFALAKANADHFGTLMPTITIIVNKLDLMTSAVLSQLWTDATYCYSMLVAVNPGSNPQVKYVRDRSEKLLIQSKS